MYPSGGKKKQSRIVVNVEQLAAERGRKKGVGAVLGRVGAAGGRNRALSIGAVVALALLLVALLGGYLWWQSYKSSPAYSFALLLDAARRDDGAQVAQLVDSERVAQSLVPQVLDKAVASVGGMGAVAAPRRQLETALPNLLTGMRDELQAELARGIKDAAQNVGDYPVWLVALAAPRLWVGVREEGDGRAVVSLPRGEGRTPAEAVFERDGERWKMTGLADEELAANLARRVATSFVAQPSSTPQPAAAGGNNANRRRRPATR